MHPARQCSAHVIKNCTAKGLIVVIGFLLAFISPAQTESSDPAILACVGNIKKITSYNVLLQVAQLTFPNVNDLNKSENVPVRIPLETTRDILAVGKGRRIERSFGATNSYQIGVVEWKTALRNGKPSPKALSFVLPGITFNDYLNPACGDVFLADLLEDTRSKITKLEPTSAGSFPGYEVNHPKLRGPVRIWLDPEHSNMPKTVEWYNKVRSEVALKDKLVLEEYTKSSIGIFVPAKGAYSSFIMSGAAKGRAYLGFSMAVKESSFNSVTADELFRTNSLPGFNHEDAGWKYEVPAAMLPAIKKAAEMHQEAKRPQPTTDPLLVIVAVSLPAIAWLTYKLVKSLKSDSSDEGSA